MFVLYYTLNSIYIKLRDQVKILVGGAPVTEAFAKEIGADGYAPDAGSAAKLAKTLTASA